jgi:hypothetical protein
MVLYIPRLPDQISLAPVWGDKLVHGFVFALAVWCWNNALGLAGRQAAQPSSELPAPAEDSPGVVLKPAEHSGIHRIIHRIGRLPKGGPRLWLVAAIFAVHALVSEMIQGRLLPARSADPSDCLADLVGIALAVSLAMWAARSARRPVVDPA